uniref:Putative ribonuclease H-like domain-containing protein n=1 Tax=Helianthus annuus TaxID=4232 RepID=A0A251VPF2_HELAN
MASVLWYSIWIRHLNRDMTVDDFNTKYGGGKAATAIANSLNKEFASQRRDDGENIEKIILFGCVLDRGEKIEFPVDKTENLRSQVLLVNKGIDIDGSLKIIRFTYVFAGETFRVTEFIDKMVSDVEPMKPPPVESTFKLVQDVKDLKELTVKLCDANEFAVDLEHNHYRSFQGLTCWCKYLPERKILS